MRRLLQSIFVKKTDTDISEFEEYVANYVLPYQPEQLLRDNLQQVKGNNPNLRRISIDGNYVVRNMTDNDWEEVGRDINNNTHLRELFFRGSLDNQKMIALFRGLRRGYSIKEITLSRNDVNVESVQSMVPFLQSTYNLKKLDVSSNNIGSEGFNTLFRALCDSAIEELHCVRCCIDSMEINGGLIPLNLRELHLTNNEINTDGVREVIKLLQPLRGDSTLKKLFLGNNNIDAEGVEILVDALQSNISLKQLWLDDNNFSHEGYVSLLKLVSDVSSIKATLQSNHTLHYLSPSDGQSHIFAAMNINRLHKNNREAAGRAKVISTQLNSVTRNALCQLQGVNRSLYSEINHGINPLHLPEILSLVGQNHGQKELYAALKSSVAGLISTVNRKQCIQERRDYYAAKVAELDAELEAIEAVESNVVEIGSNK